MGEWTAPRRYLTIFTQRGGSTYLAHCVDSHPDVGFERGEPLNPLYIWRQAFPKARAETLLDLALNRPGYKVTVARVNYRHITEVGGGYLSRLDGIIHLHRPNVVRIIVSAMINAQGLRPAHSYEPAAAQKVELDAKKVVRECNRYVGNVRTRRKWLGRLGVPLLLLTYDSIVGGEGTEAVGIPQDTSARICEFLDVEHRPLTCDLKRTNPEPLEDLVLNWQEVKAALDQTEHRRWTDA